MSFEERYYREELDYLRQLGKLLGREKPYLARFLAEKEGDPDVERLMEAFAFLSGSLREKLEDEFPEFTHGLINMLWPNYLRPVPSMAVIEYKSVAAQLSAPAKVCRDELISSGQVRVTSPGRRVLTADDIAPSPVCHFTLARDVWLQPLHIRDVRNTSTLKKGSIDIDFFTEGNVSPDSLDLSKLTFWLGNDDDYTRQQLYLWFSERLMDAELVAGERRVPQPDLWLDSAGFEREEALLPWPKNVHNGYRVLQEYFCYPESFFFFHLRNATSLPDDFPVRAFTLRLHFNLPLPADIKLRENSLRPYCTPAVNLFAHHAEPVSPDDRSPQYALRASQQNPEYYDIFQVKSVSSKVSASDKIPGPNDKIHTWPEFEGFQHQIEYSRQREAVYWHHRTKTSLFHQGLDHAIAFVHADGSQPDSSRLRGEVFTASLVCTNRMLPVSLHISDICVPVNKNPAVASFSNVTRPTRPLYPVTDGDMHWSLISCMNLNYLSLLDREALIQVLRTFDLPGIHHPQQARLSTQKLDAIEKMESRPIDRLFKGVPVRGLSTTLWVNPAPFVCEGEVYLLGTVLSHFFALYASINSFHCLKIINTESQESWEWQHTGQHALM
ncbi:type VI secretion system baseplate subunit TssF [Salmonella enterica]|uniref:Type VI secretion system baseplate subunit TssF n=2 Tax=Salmonella enterica TaxID=28901 RepID=A0A701ZHQ6_SALER|nr:type VI secretion system baseplate subunit TssF [Salmonella enterica]ESE81344.1 type VI secretion protein, family [Salmonella enterica subsp. indica serovar 6,14,25:z10:1,(2),7 str. 1121]HAC6576743.1 type VI secretion system baseplate subunit TssF [Salmonella enterica subsp. indica]MBA3215971.1 type VI secretion system baseplate subunit TssF [Salmonella enterica]HBC0059895.1 type VI secretion system baseplate subunit TssF [Salmonella enterica]HCL5302230.1 type VI secretion system baseplate 